MHKWRRRLLDSNLRAWKSADGLENCNGQTDENNPGGGAACSSGLQGVCEPGTMKCLGGVVSCKQNVVAAGGACTMGSDNDCNGLVDNRPETASLRSCTCRLRI